jgi:hypothetical protein
MASNSSDLTPRRHWKLISVAVVASALLAWGFLHPPFRADASTIAPEILAELARTGFAQTQGVTEAHLETLESFEGLPERWTSEQRIVPVDRLLTEKRTRRQAQGISEESSGLYVGPIAVVRHHRNRLPFIADLLPYQFWNSSRVSEFKVEEVDRFPHGKGGKLVARVTREDRYAGGELAQTERCRLQCEVVEIAEANSINAALSGTAARIQCRDDLEPNGRQWGPTNPRTFAVERVTYSHWYAFDRGWSIPIEGEEVARLGEAEALTRKWSMKLISFESAVR